MKNNIKYWLLIVLVANSFKVLGQESDTLILKKIYSDSISLKAFINEVNTSGITTFKEKLLEAILKNNTGIKGDISYVFTAMDSDNTIQLDFQGDKTKHKQVSKLTIKTILEELNKNEKFKGSLLVRLNPPLKENGIAISTKKGDKEESSLSKYWYWGIVSLLTIVLCTMSAWYLSSNLIAKKFFKMLNSTFYPGESSKIYNQNDIGNLLEVKETKKSEEIVKLKNEKKYLEDTLEKTEQKLKSLENSIEENSSKSKQGKNHMEELQQKEISGQSFPSNSTDLYYFSSVNREDNNLGIFQDENKTIYKESDSIYSFEIKKTNNTEANFWFDASHTSHALSYRSYMVEPFCTSQTPFFEGCTRITHVEKGTARFERGRWIVTKKAVIMYV